MKTDTYTKTVLTIIAICLVILAGKSLDSGLVVSTAYAQKKDITDVNLVQINGVGVNTGLVEPTIQGASLPVNIQRINGHDFTTPVRGGLPVRVQE